MIAQADRDVPSRPGIGTFIAAILLPPLAVWLVRGIAPAFWIALLLTCLAFVPGLLFSLAAVIAPRLLPERPHRA
jgi:uncharacterized membrane protein YqaE (UPF0057 family)